jgi:hypothetical protein
MSVLVSRPWLYGVAFPFLLVVFPVFVDIAYGALGTSGRAGLFSVGVLFRGGIAALGLYLILRSRDLPLKVFLFVFFTIFFLSNIVWALTSDEYSLGHELVQGMKIAFPWLLAGIFLHLDRRASIDRLYLFSVLAWAGFLSALSILFAIALGIGQETYGSWSYGQKGFFNAQNDIGLKLILTLVAAVVVLCRTRKVTPIVMTATIVGAGLLLGTRTGVLAGLLVAVAFLLAAIPNRRLFAPSGGIRGWKATAALILPVIVALSVAAAIFSQSERTLHLTTRMATLTEETPRSRLETAGVERLTNRGLVLTLFGDGGLAFKKHVAENLGRGRYRTDFEAFAAPGESKKLAFPVQRVENDIIDVLGFYGVLQFAVVYGGLALVFVLALRSAIRAWNIENVASVIILLLFFGHSSLAGHALFSAQVTTVMAPIIFLQLRDLRWRRNERAAHGTAGVAETPAQ